MNEFQEKFIGIPEKITVSDLAVLLNRKPSQVLIHLMSYGRQATVNQPIDHTVAALVVEGLGYTAIPLFAKKHPKVTAEFIEHTQKYFDDFGDLPEDIIGILLEHARLSLQPQD